MLALVRNGSFLRILARALVGAHFFGIPGVVRRGPASDLAGGIEQRRFTRCCRTRFPPIQGVLVPQPNIQSVTFPCFTASGLMFTPASSTLGKSLCTAFKF